MPCMRAWNMASAISPITSSCNWLAAALPMRTGLAPPNPGSQSASHSVSRRSPPMPYMICICSGLPATARSSQSRQAFASSA